MIREIHNSWIPRFLGVTAITLYPYICYEDVPKIETRVHELVHCKQIEALGRPKFYWQYLKSYLKFRRQGLVHYDAYRKIPFEIEAFDLQAKFEQWYSENLNRFPVRDDLFIKSFMHSVKVKCANT